MSTAEKKQENILLVRGGVSRDVHAREFGVIRVLLDQLGDAHDGHIEVPADVDALSRQARLSGEDPRSTNPHTERRHYLQFWRELTHVVERQVGQLAAVLDVQVLDLCGDASGTDSEAV